MTDVFHNHGKRIGIFVIAYNAESHIQQTLKRIPADIWEAVDQVYVIDDCSSDNTVERALECLPWSSKLRVLRNRVNQRYGGNQKLGYQYALDAGFDVVVMLHADGQYAPEVLGRILSPIVGGEADVVMGSRMMQPGHALQGGMPKYKYVGNRVLTRVQNLLTGLRLSEFHSGYRAYSTAFLKRAPFWENADEWHFDSQILLQAHKAGMRMVEVPIPTYYGSEICHVNGLVYGAHCILTACQFFLFQHGLLYSRLYDLDVRGRKYHGKFTDPYSSHSIILNLLKQGDSIAGQKVLELGVGDTSLTEKLAAMGALVDGVELDGAAVALAKPFCRRVLEADLDHIESLPLEGPYRCIIAADILEHLRDPEGVLSRLKKHLSPEGQLIVSLPNVANIYVRLNLLIGRFPQHAKGLLDRTHLRYFTLKSARQLLTRTGWIITRQAVTAIPLGVVFPFLARRPFSVLLSLFYGLTRILKGLLAYQVILVCRNPNRPELL